MTCLISMVLGRSLLIDFITDNSVRDIDRVKEAVTGQQMMLTQPRYLMPPLMLPEILVCLLRLLSILYSC